MKLDQNFVEELAARMSLHEFLLEQLFANAFIQGDEALARWQVFGEDVVEKMGKPYTTQQSLSEDQLKYLERQSSLGADFAERFVQKVSARIQSKQSGELPQQ